MDQRNVCFVVQTNMIMNSFSFVFFFFFLASCITDFKTIGKSGAFTQQAQMDVVCNSLGGFRASPLTGLCLCALPRCMVWAARACAT